MSIESKFRKWARTNQRGNATGSSSFLITLLPKDINNVLILGVGESTTELDSFEKMKVKAIGIEINPETVLNLKDPRVTEGDMHDLVFKDNSFDLVWGKDVFEHAVSHIIALDECCRVSKKYVALVIPNEERWGRSKDHLICPTSFQMRNLGNKVGLGLGDYKQIGNLEYYLFGKGVRSRW